MSVNQEMLEALTQCVASLAGYRREMYMVGLGDRVCDAEARAVEIISHAKDHTDDPVQVTNAAADVLAERRRQIEDEGWTPEHDDQHMQGQMALAAGNYALCAGFASKWNGGDTTLCKPAPQGWPWPRAWWKPTNSRRDLVKAAALILAEIERLDRMNSPEAGG